MPAANVLPLAELVGFFRWRKRHLLQKISCWSDAGRQPPRPTHQAVDLGDVAVGYLVPDLELLLGLRVDALQVPAGVALRRPFAHGRGGTVVVVVPRGLRLVVRQTTPRVVSPRALGPMVGATTR